MGKLRTGEGQITTASGALQDIPYSFGTRFEERRGTNPEELLAAAHAACFTMAVAAELEKRGLRPEFLETEAITSLLQEAETGWSIDSVHLRVYGDVPGATENQFKNAAETAKVNCPVSRLFKAKITLDASLGEVTQRSA